MTYQNESVHSLSEILDLKKQGFLKGYGEEDFIKQLSKEDFDFDFFKRLLNQFLVDGGNLTYVIQDVKYEFHRCWKEGCCR